MQKTSLITVDDPVVASTLAGIAPDPGNERMKLEKLLQRLFCGIRRPNHSYNSW